MVVCSPLPNCRTGISDVPRAGVSGVLVVKTWLSRTLRMAWVQLLGVALLATLAFQWRALLVPASGGMKFSVFDVARIFEGYHVAQRSGCGVWWHGEWINYGSRYYRPLASHFHYAQCWAIEHGYFQAATAGLMLVYAAIAFAAGVLTYYATGRRWAAAVAVVWVASWRSGDWLSYYILADNVTCAACGFLGIAGLVAWSQTRKPVALAAAWAGLVAACFCKEQGYVYPVCALAIVYGLPKVRYRNAALGQGAGMTAAAVCVALWARHVVRERHPGLPVANFWIGALLNREVWLVALLALTVGAAVLIWRTRRAGWALLPLLAPLLCSQGPAYALVYVVDNAQMMLSEALALAVLVVAAVAYRCRFSTTLALYAAYRLALLPTLMGGMDQSDWRQQLWVPLWPAVALCAAIEVAGAVKNRAALFQAARPILVRFPVYNWVTTASVSSALPRATAVESVPPVTVGEPGSTLAG